jgi:hypothetical protein
LIVGFMVGLAFLLFGGVFFIVTRAEDSVPGQGFTIFWMFICLIITGFYGYSLIYYDDAIKSSPIDIGIMDGSSGSRGDGDDAQAGFEASETRRAEKGRRDQS